MINYLVLIVTKKVLPKFTNKKMTKKKKNEIKRGIFSIKRLIKFKAHVKAIFIIKKLKANLFFLILFFVVVLVN